MQEVRTEVARFEPWQKRSSSFPLNVKRNEVFARRKFPGAEKIFRQRSRHVDCRRLHRMETNKFLLSSTTHHDHLGGLEDEAFVGSPGAATRPLAKAAQQKITWLKIHKSFFSKFKNFYVAKWNFFQKKLQIVGEEVGYFVFFDSPVISLMGHLPRKFPSNFIFSIEIKRIKIYILSKRNFNIIYLDSIDLR